VCSSDLSAQVGAAFGMKLDQEILYGTNSLLTAAVGHAGSKAVTLSDASAPTLAEITEMYMANINPTVADWYVSGKVYQSLIGLEDTNGNKVLTPNYAVSPFGTLFGRPVHIVNCMKGANGVAGTIGFCDFANGYLVGTKGGVKFSRSVELYWLTDQEAMRWILRVGGAPTKASTLTLADSRAVASLVFGHDA
jgi:HK97 family phage major capsid protein